MLSVQSHIARAFVRVFLRTKHIHHLPLGVLRRAFDNLSMPVPRGVRVEAVGNKSVKGFWLVPPGAANGAAMLYLHGGAYGVGSSRSHRGLAGALAVAANARVFVTDYRLAPEHVFPAALIDARAAYEYMLGLGISSQQIVVAGDSAGGGLAVSLAHTLRDAGVLPPAGLLLFSPWTDLALTGTTIDSLAADDPMLTKNWLAAMAAAYRGAADAREPGLSPLYGVMRGLPSMHIQVGSDEILLADSERLAQAARAGGVEVDYFVGEGMWHIWQSFGALVPEAKAAIERAGQFVRSRTHANGGVP